MKLPTLHTFSVFLGAELFNSSSNEIIMHLLKAKYKI